MLLFDLDWCPAPNISLDKQLPFYSLALRTHPVFNRRDSATWGILSRKSGRNNSEYYHICVAKESWIRKEKSKEIV